MISQLSLRDLPRPYKGFVFAFLFVLSVGYFTGLTFVAQTDSTRVEGMIENYNGNESEEEVKVMKFKKSKREMLTIIHTHVLSIGFIFAFLGFLVWSTAIPSRWKAFLTIEPFCSVIVTFGGIYLIWLGYTFMAYIVMISGLLMTLSFVLGVLVVGNELIKKPNQP
ncbi:MAG: hypothetical protein ACPHUE_02850 [Flavobacteriaceae bacterium]